MIFALGVMVSCNKKDEVKPTTNNNTNNPKIFSYNHIDLSGIYKMDTNTIIISKYKLADTIVYNIQGVFSNYDNSATRRLWKEDFIVINGIATTSKLIIYSKENDRCFIMKYSSKENRDYCENRLELTGNNLLWKALITGNGGPITKLLNKK